MLYILQAQGADPASENMKGTLAKKYMKQHRQILILTKKIEYYDSLPNLLFNLKNG